MGDGSVLVYDDGWLREVRPIQHGYVEQAPIVDPDGRAAFAVAAISFCPWCGAKLAEVDDA